MNRGFIWTGLLFFVGCLASQPPLSPSEVLKQIPSQDREFLSSFFKGLLTQGSFAATLFGEKAASSFDYPLQLILHMEDQRLKERFLLEAKGWRLWDQYRPLFNIKKFLFVHLPHDFPSIVFVHKEKIVSVIEEHLSFFQRHFSKNPFSEKLEDFLLAAFTPNFHVYNFHIAQGLLLGYPWSSCVDFQNQFRIEDTLAYFPYDTEEKFSNSCSTLDSLVDMYPEDLIKKHLQFKENFSRKSGWSCSNPFFCTSAPSYMAFHAPLDPTLEEVKGRIVELFNSDYFLEDLIAILTK